MASVVKIGGETRSGNRSECVGSATPMRGKLLSYREPPSRPAVYGREQIHSGLNRHPDHQTHGNTIDAAALQDHYNRVTFNNHAPHGGHRPIDAGSVRSLNNQVLTADLLSSRLFGWRLFAGLLFNFGGRFVFF